LRVAAPFLAAADREREDVPPRTLLSSSSARPRSSLTAPCTSLGAFSPASAIARAVRLRMPLSRSFLKRSLSRPDLAIRLLLRRVAGRAYFYPAARSLAARCTSACGLLSAFDRARLPAPTPVLA
jgi:hypothetical protein